MSNELKQNRKLRYDAKTKLAAVNENSLNVQEVVTCRSHFHPKTFH